MLHYRLCTTASTSVRSHSESVENTHYRSSHTTGTLYSDRASALQIREYYSHAAATLQILRSLQRRYRCTTARRLHYSIGLHYSMVGMCSARDCLQRVGRHSLQQVITCSKGSTIHAAFPAARECLQQGWGTPTHSVRAGRTCVVNHAYGDVHV